MGTVTDRWDHAIAWVQDPGKDSPHNQRPVFLGDYVTALEALVRSGDSGPDDLGRLRARMGLGADLAPGPRLQIPASPDGQQGFRSHAWVGMEVSTVAQCQACGVSSNTIQSMKRCVPA